jgi:hypothetical protein
MATKLYLRQNASANNPTSGSKSTTNPKYTISAQGAASQPDEALTLSTTAGSALAFSGWNSDATISTRTIYIARYTSSTLAAQSIAAGTWTFACEFTETNINADSFLSLAVYLAVPGGSSIKAAIYDASTDLGAEWGATRLGQVITFSGAAVSAAAGDVVVLEVFRNTDNTGQAMATAYAQQINYGEATDVTAGSTAAGGSYLLTPAAVTLSFGGAPPIVVKKLTLLGVG